MIDTHLHCVPPDLPGVGPLAPELREVPAEVARLLRDAMEAAGVHAALAMGSAGGGDGDPLGVAKTLEIAALVPGLHAIGIADPRRTDPVHLRRVEQQLAERRVAALKCYLGYLHYAPSDPGYRPYYELAARHKLPVFFHTGDTYSPYAKLKYAHPLGVDEVAVDHPDVRFVIAHLGNPWLTDAAEVVYKNVNVWADLSGLFVGGGDDLTDPAGQEAVREMLERVRAAFRYAERPNRFLYGSDWPLAPMTLYRDLIRTAIPEAHHEQVFVENARTLFPVLRG